MSLNRHTSAAHAEPETYVPSIAPIALAEEQIGRAQTLGSPTNLEIALDIAVRAAAQNTGASAVAIALMENGVLVCRARCGDIAPDLGVVLNASTGITGACVRTAQILSCCDTEADERVDINVCRTLGIRSILVIPILVDGAVAGLLETLSVKPAAFGPLHEQRLQRVVAFVHDLACQNATTALVGRRNLRTEPSSRSGSHGASAEPSSSLCVQADGSESPELDPGVAAFRGVLEKATQTSSWEDICQQLASRLQR